MERPLLGFFAGIFVIVAVACFLGAATQPAIFTSVLGTWVQGLGSVGAILAAIWVSTVPLQVQREERRRVHQEGLGITVTGLR
jgi:DNA-binding transcriptional regulator of glucitol operon